MIELAHGHGGRKTLELVQQVILPALGAPPAPVLDSARLADGRGNDLALTTDSFTVSPLFFPGGDIGKLSVCGAVNDLAVAGAEPRWLSLALIIEEGFPIEDLRRILASAGEAARQAGVAVVCGDTKVVERGKADGLFTSVAGVGRMLVPRPFGPDAIRPGDVILVSGGLGQHGAAILAARNRLPMGQAIQSDCACLWPMTRDIIEAGGDALHAMRDLTRGGLAAALNELATDSRTEFVIREADVPVRAEVRELLEVLGMDPLSLANEGRLAAWIAPNGAEAALAAMRRHPLGRDAAVIGQVARGREPGRVLAETAFGTRRVLDMPVGEGLPRIC